MNHSPTDLQFNDDLEQEDLLIQMWERIAEGLAALSEASETPTNVTAPTWVFSGSDVDFKNDSWVPHLVEVQGWLNFSRLLPTDSPRMLLETLVGELGLDSAAEVHVEGDKTCLTPAAWERFEERVDVASRLQRQFLDQRGDGISRSEASINWQDGWDQEELDNEPTSSEPVTAKAVVWDIDQLSRKKLNLTPTYQRGDVWNTRDRQALIESILRGIPLPSIVLLRAGASKPHEVVDGKQRLTAILRFVGKHPRALEIVDEADSRFPNANLRKYFDTDYPKFRKAWKSVMQESLSGGKEDAYFFPFKLRNSGDGGLVGPGLQALQGKYYTDIKQHIITVGNQELEVKELFEGSPDYMVPVIEYTSADPRQIHEVFKLYNKQGVHLNAEELRNAVFHDIEITRAILVAAGDADPRADLAAFAPSLLKVDRLSTLGENLKGYKIGTSRYKRTKILGWLLSTLLLEIEQENLKSTARHIDDFLLRVQNTPNDPLRDEGRLRELFSWIVRTVELHSGYDEIWAPRFKDTQDGVKWQELQLVGSLVGLSMATALSADDIEDRIEARGDLILQASGSESWQRPKKTQTRTQWDYIARLAEDVVRLLDLDPIAATQAVRVQFGSSGYESLQRARM